MHLDPLKVEIAAKITERFLNLRQPSPRKPLAVLVRDGGVLDEMELRSLIRAEKNRTEYFPTLGTFAILNADDEKYIKARDGIIKVLHTLVNLYEVDDASTQYTLEELIKRVRDRYDSVDPDEISLGLYLAVSGFGAIQSYGFTPDGNQVTSFTIAEQVLKIVNPAAAWAERVAIARSSASAPAPTFEATAKMKFDDAVSEIYESAIQENRNLTKRYENAGIAEAGNFARQAVDYVLNAFRKVEGIFRSIYLDPFSEGGLDPLMEVRLRQILELTLTAQTTRAQDVTRNLCISFVTPLSDRFSALDARVVETGNRIKERLANAITLRVMKGFEVDSMNENDQIPDPIESAPSSKPKETGQKKDVFISHASEDKPYVEPLVAKLEEAGISVWYDRLVLEWGDDLRSRIDTGLANCRYGIVVLSKAFLGKKKWTEHELNGLFAREQAGQKLILPIWHGITRDDLLQYSPAFADRLAKISDTDSYEDIVHSLRAILGRQQKKPSVSIPPSDGGSPTASAVDVVNFVRVEPKEGHARFREAGQPLGLFWNQLPFAEGPDYEVYLAEGAALWLRLSPRYAISQEWNHLELRKCGRGPDVALRPLLWNNMQYLRAEDGIGAYATLDNLTNETHTNSVAFAFDTGELWSIDTSVLQLTNDKRIDFLSVARVLIQNLNRYGQFLQCLGIKSPFHWKAGIEGVKGWKLQVPGAATETCLSDSIEASGTYDVGQNGAETLRPFFDRMFQKCSMQLPAAIDQAIRSHQKF
jgi:TIR domain